MTVMPAGHRPQLVTITEAAAICDVWPDTIRHWLTKRIVTRYRIGTNVRVDLAECVATRSKHRARTRGNRASVHIAGRRSCATGSEDGA